MDSSLNGIQVDNDGSAVRKIAFGVDAAMETFEQAAAVNAGLLFVHHGLFWGAPSNSRKFKAADTVFTGSQHLPVCGAFAS